MSLQEDSELSDLVAKTLENSGVLAKIRAELRASVFLVLEEHEAFKGRNLSTLNKPLTDFVASQEGKIIIGLIREFLEFFGLEFTASVFEPEVLAVQSYEYSGREKLAEELKLSSGKKSPLIAQVLQESKVFFPRPTTQKDKLLDNKNEKTKDQKKVQENNCLHSGSSPNTTGNALTTENPCANNEGKSTMMSNTPLSIQNHPKKPESLFSNQVNLKPTGSLLSSLSGLPPLGISQNNQSNKTSSNKSTKQVSHDIKALLELGSDSPENNYEEDFHPSSSDKASKATNRSLSGSGSEIEEEVSVGIEDRTTDLSSGGSGKSSGTDL